MAKKKIALFGGTFDPIHIGHTTVAAAAAKHISAEKIIFIPAKCSPLKGTLPKASDKDRLKMIEMAIMEDKIFAVSDYELKRPQPSYTLETVRQFQINFGNEVSLYWLIGADSIDDLPYWYGIIELIDECNLCAMYRAGCKRPDFAKFKAVWGAERIEKLQQNIIQTPIIDISSTEIRNRLSKGLDVSAMLHPPVAEYIRKNGLYQSGT